MTLGSYLAFWHIYGKSKTQKLLLLDVEFFLRNYTHIQKILKLLQLFRRGQLLHDTAGGCVFNVLDLLADIGNNDFSFFLTKG